MRIRYAPQAFSDRERILEYLKERSASGARNVAVSIREAVAQIKNHPHSGYRTEDPDVRVIFVARYLQDFLPGARCGRDFAYSTHVTKGMEGR